ncbi:hypothetical protein BaRGS_00014740 [Batillaria attramentaria]|uniref:Uncharacterized protein n=1 Tax=Batillaria attramentaria TaxID=370345 RepID=A0ABD0L4U9_9CAEN
MPFTNVHGSDRLNRHFYPSHSEAFSFCTGAGKVRVDDSMTLTRGSCANCVFSLTFGFCPESNLNPPEHVCKAFPAEPKTTTPNLNPAPLFPPPPPHRHPYQSPQTPFPSDLSLRRWNARGK